jgi:hypothetical protein
MVATWRLVVPWIRVSAQRVSPMIEICLRVLEALEAESLERRTLRMTDARLDLALAIRVSRSTWQCGRAVVEEDVAVELVDRGIVDVGLEDSFAEIVEHDDTDHSTETTKRFLVELGPDARARSEAQQPNRLATEAERQDEESRAAVSTTRIADHRTCAVVDLTLDTRRRHDHRMRIRAALLRQSPDEALHAGVLRGEAVLIDEVLPDRLRVATDLDRPLDDLAVRLASTGLRARTGHRLDARVGGHFVGRF